jgi:hypothetical protein
MDNKVEDASLEGTKTAYLKCLSSLNVARTHYEASGKKSKKLLENVKDYEMKVKKYEEKLRRCGMPPESIFCKKNGNLPRIDETAQQHPDDVACQIF